MINNNRYLIHYGVLGMKWGIRHDDDEPKNTKNSKNVDTAKDNSVNAPIYIKRLPDNNSIENIVSDVNPNHGIYGYNENCTRCTIAAALRYKGYDVTASAGYTDFNMNDTVEKVFKDSQSIYHLVRYKESVDDIKAAIIESCCNGTDKAFGSITVSWKDVGYAHIFNWIYEDGEVIFLDGQNGKSGDELDCYWDQVKIGSKCRITRLDNCEIDWDAASDFVENNYKEDYMQDERKIPKSTTRTEKAKNFITGVYDRSIDTTKSYIAKGEKFVNGIVGIFKK